MSLLDGQFCLLWLDPLFHRAISRDFLTRNGGSDYVFWTLLKACFFSVFFVVVNTCSAFASSE